MAEALVEFDYDAEQDDELTIRIGDVIKNVGTGDGGWWEGELKGKKGMFPDNFVKLRVKEVSTKKEEKREATQRKSVKELANKFKDGVPISGSQGSVSQKKKDAPKTKKCKVMFDYKPENEDELELTVGQIIDFNKEVEEGWWEGTLQGKTGVFPSNFVSMLENGEGADHHAANGSKPSSGNTAGESEDFQQIKGKKVMGVGLGNIFQGGPIKLRNTKKGEPAKPPSKSDDKDGKDARHSPANTTDASKREKQGVERAIVRYSYAAEQPDELSLKEGEVIRVLDKHLEDDGWWKGEAHGKVGVFPDNFVELLPSQEEPSKAPKKPPPPAGKNMYPKLPEKSLSVEEKNASVRRDQAGHRKSNLTKRRLASEDGEEASFDAVEATSHKLTHLTASRAKGPKKRPPSTVNFSAEVDKLEAIDEPAKGQNHVPHMQPDKPPLPTNKDHRHISPTSEPERGLYHHRHPHPGAQDNHSNSSRDGHHDNLPPRHSTTHHTASASTALPPRPPEPSRHSGPDTSALTQLVEDLQRELRELRNTTVSKNEYNDLRSDYLRLRQEFDSFRTSHAKKLRDLMLEVDEEKKLRLNTQVEVERVRKLLTETHV